MSHISLKQSSSNYPGLGPDSSQVTSLINNESMIDQILLELTSIMMVGIGLLAYWNEVKYWSDYYGTNSLNWNSKDSPFYEWGITAYWTMGYNGLNFILTLIAQIQPKSFFNKFPIVTSIIGFFAPLGTIGLTIWALVAQNSSSSDLKKKGLNDPNFNLVFYSLISIASI